MNGEAGYKPELPVANGILLPMDQDLAAIDPSSLAPVIEALITQQPAAPSVDAVLV